MMWTGHAAAHNLSDYVTCTEQNAVELLDRGQPAPCDKLGNHTDGEGRASRSLGRSGLRSSLPRLPGRRLAHLQGE